MLICQNQKRMKAKSEAYQKNIEKRGKVPSSLTVRRAYIINIEKRG